MSEFHYIDEQTVEVLEELKEEIEQKNSSSATQGYIDSVEGAITLLKKFDDELFRLSKDKATGRGLRFCKVAYYGYCYFHKWINDNEGLVESWYDGEVFIAKPKNITFLD